MTARPLGASFRDPAGFVFRHDGRIYRQVNRAGAEDYELFRSSGLYRKLTDAGLLVPHDEVDPPASVGDESGRDLHRDLHYKTLRPEPIDFVSYPYEWPFSLLKDAASLTLRIQRVALRAGMSLKDASAYNVQLQRGRPVFIDTLSFERHRDGEPWAAYRQFCQHFLAPLALMALRDVRLQQLLKVHVDGVPLDLATALLPKRAWLRPGLWMHLRLHARAQRRHAASASAKAPALSKAQLMNVTRSLGGTVGRLSWEPSGTEWADYTRGDSYDDAGLADKRARVGAWLRSIAPRTVWDVGANTGVYSRLAAEAGARVVAFDVDPACVERSYRELRERRETGVLPLLLDLTNPSPAIGWANDERETIGARGRPDVVLALALVHHLAISNNVPLPAVASYLASLADELIVEFVPKSDAKVVTLLATRRDVFPDYTREGFEAAFGTRFALVDAADVAGSDRRLYRMRRRGAA